MKKLLNLMLVVLTICGIACSKDAGNSRPRPNEGNNSLSFTIQLSNITSSSVYMAVTPSNNTDTYFFDVVPQYVMAHYATPEAFATDYVSQLISLYEQYDLVFADALSKGADAWQYELGDLEPNTEYYAIAFGVTPEGTITTKVTMESFRTLEPTPAAPSDNVLTVDVSQITAAGALISVETTNNDTYYFDVIEKSAIDEYGSPLDFALEYIVRVKNTYEAYGYTLADALSSGPDSYLYDYLSPNCEYCAIAFGVTADCCINTSVVTVPFKTLEKVKSDKAFNNLSYGYYTNYGDYYESNAANWYIDLYPEEGMDMLILEVQTPLDATDFTGNYPLASTFDAGTAVAGFIDSESYIGGSYWCTLNSSYEIADYAFCKTGNVAISKSGEDYTIVVDAVDPDGYKITANYTGTIEEYTDDSASTLSTKKGMARRFRFIPKDRNTKVAQPLCRNAIVKLKVEGAQSRLTKPFRVAVK